METNYLVWMVGMTTLFVIAHRLLLWFLVQRKLGRSYEQELEDVLTNDAYKVRGKFE